MSRNKNKVKTIINNFNIENNNVNVNKEEADNIRNKEDLDINLRDKRLNLMFKVLWFFSYVFLVGIYLFIDMKNNLSNFQNMYMLCVVSAILFSFSFPIMYSILLYILKEIKCFKIKNDVSEIKNVELIYEKLCRKIEIGFFISVILFLIFIIFETFKSKFDIFSIFLDYKDIILLILTVILIINFIIAFFINKFEIFQFIITYIIIFVMFLIMFQEMNVEYQNNLILLRNLYNIL